MFLWQTWCSETDFTYTTGKCECHNFSLTLASLRSFSFSRKKVGTESSQVIRERYQDTAILIFKDLQKRYPEAPRSNASGRNTPDTHYKYSRYGNEPVLVRKEGANVTRRNEVPVQSAICSVMWLKLIGIWTCHLRELKLNFFLWEM